MSEVRFPASAPCMWMRGGTSKGGYFLADALPESVAKRDAFLLRVMGSPDPRQIDGMGGADPLTSKVAVIKKSERPGIDVDYLFLQVFVDQAIVTDAQNCGNILAGVGPFAIERGLIAVQDGVTPVKIFMENTDQVAVAQVPTPEGQVIYSGDARIDGVPGKAGAIPITFKDTAGSSCGALLPSGNAVDVIDGIEVTMIDNGMPVVVLRAEDMGITGTESREELDANTELKEKLESIRLKSKGNEMTMQGHFDTYVDWVNKAFYPAPSEFAAYVGVTGSHCDLADWLESLGWVIDLDAEDNDHSVVREVGSDIVAGHIVGDSEAVITATWSGN